MKKVKYVSLGSVVLAVLILAGCGKSEEAPPSGRASNPEGETLGITLDDLYENNTLEHFDEEGVTWVRFSCEVTSNGQRQSMSTTDFNRYEYGYGMVTQTWNGNTFYGTSYYYPMNEKDVFCKFQAGGYIDYLGTGDYVTGGEITRMVYTMEGYKEYPLLLALEGQTLTNLSEATVQNQSDDEKEIILGEAENDSKTQIVIVTKAPQPVYADMTKQRFTKSVYKIDPETKHIRELRRELNDDANTVISMSLNYGTTDAVRTKDDIPRDVQYDYEHGNYTRAGSE